MQCEAWSSSDQQAAEILVMLKGSKANHAPLPASSQPALVPLAIISTRTRSRAASPDTATPESAEHSSSLSRDNIAATEDHEGTSKTSQHSMANKRSSRCRTRNDTMAASLAAKGGKSAAPHGDSVLSSLPLLSAIFANHQGSLSAVTRSQSSSFPNSPVHPSCSDTADHRSAVRRCHDDCLSYASADSRVQPVSTKRAASPALNRTADVPTRPSKVPRAPIAATATAEGHSAAKASTKPSTSSSTANSLAAMKAAALKRVLPVPTLSHTLLSLSTGTNIATTYETGAMLRCRPAPPSRPLLQQLPIMQHLPGVIPPVHVFSGCS